MKPVKPIPDGYHSITPYLIVQDGASMIEFYKRAFGASELMRVPGPGGKIGHAEIQIGDSRVMLADEHPEMGALSPKTIGGAPGYIVLYVEDCDTIVTPAIAAGAEVIRPLGNQFYGDRTATLRDPSGHQWTISTHVEDVTPEEIDRRLAEMKAKGGGC